MVNGYVGFISRQGLCQIEIERPDTLRRTQAAVTGHRQARVGFWAILPPQQARDIFALLDEGESKEALRLLNQAARDCGHLLPQNQ